MTTNIKEKALQLGYSSCGIIPAATFKEYYEALDKRIESFPESKRFYESMYESGASEGKSIIVCIYGYNHFKVPQNLEGHFAKYYLFHSDIAYSKAFRAKSEFESYLQTLGLCVLKSQEPPMRWAAVKAGLGKFGRNNFVYTNEHGSHIHIDAWTVDGVLDYDQCQEETLMPGCKEGCRKCVTACPTKALCDEFSMDLGKCVTYLVFRKNSNEVNEQLGQWMYGCDACQDACPMNKGKLTDMEDFPLLPQYSQHMNLENILAMDGDVYANIVHPRFWRAGKDGIVAWQRNALRCMINSSEEKYHKLILECVNRPELEEVARWGCAKLGIGLSV